MNFSTLCKHHLLMLLPITDFFSALKVLRPYIVWRGLWYLFVIRVLV